jgi:deoxyadenosine/deoxycytidine kinase
MTNIERDKQHEVEPKKHLWIQIMGVPASGKTTLGEYISRELGMSYVGETPVEDNPFFEKYYEDPEKWSLIIQMYYLFEKRHQVVGFESSGEIGVRKILESKSVISEPPIFQDGLYARARLEQYPEQMETYQDFFDGMVNDGRQNPDLLLYLRLSFPTFLRRLKERAKRDQAREVELKESKVYWKRLWELHEEWIEENPLDLNIIIINGEEFDFSKYVDPDEAKKKLFAKFAQSAKTSLVGNENIILPEALI